MGKPGYECKTKHIFEDSMQAAVALERAGIVPTASYAWNLCKVVKGADEMVIKMANYIVNTDK